MKQGNILLIAPKFYEYHVAIKFAIERKGYAVSFMNCRVSDNFIYKSALKIFPKLTSYFSTWFLWRNISFYKETEINFNKVLVIKGDGINKKLMQRIREIFPNSEFIYYSWDGVENFPDMKNLLPFFDRTYSFDPVDCQDFGMDYLPLFSSRAMIENPHSSDYDYDVSFIGALHSDRNLVVRKFARENKTLNIYMHVFSPGILQRLFCALSDISIIYSPANIKNFSLTRDEYDKITDRSKAILDVEHPKQNGYTMRTIESLLAGRKLITTNQSIAQSDLYHPSRVMILDRNRPVLDVGFLESEFKKISLPERSKYSVDNWVDTIIGEI